MTGPARLVALVPLLTLADPGRCRGLLLARRFLLLARFQRAVYEIYREAQQSLGLV